MFEFILAMGTIGILLLIFLLLIIPLFFTVILGIGFANLFGFTGIMWWAFVIVFYLVITSFMSYATR